MNRNDCIYTFYSVLIPALESAPDRDLWLTGRGCWTHLGHAIVSENCREKETETRVTTTDDGHKTMEMSGGTKTQRRAEKQKKEKVKSIFDLKITCFYTVLIVLGIILKLFKL